MNCAAIALVAIVPLTAAAEPEEQPEPDPAAERAADANLQSQARRKGFTGSVAIGPSFTLGQGTGTGGALSFRVGQVATPDMVITFELSGAAQFREVQRNEMMTELIANNTTALLVGAQYWVGPSLWVRTAFGWGAHVCTECKSTPDGLLNERSPGPTGAVGGGVDILRFKGFVLAVELSSINILHRNGMVSTNTLAAALSFD